MRNRSERIQFQIAACNMATFYSHLSCLLFAFLLIFIVPILEPKYLNTKLKQLNAAFPRPVRRTRAPRPRAARAAAAFDALAHVPHACAALGFWLGFLGNIRDLVCCAVRAEGVGGDPVQAKAFFISSFKIGF